MEKPILLDEEESAAMLGVQPGTLATWRSTGRYDLPWIKIGRNVRYRLSDVLEWIDSRQEMGK